MKKIPMLEKFAAQSLVPYNGELIFSKERFAELIVKECSQLAHNSHPDELPFVGSKILEHFGVER